LLEPWIRLVGQCVRAIVIAVILGLNSIYWFDWRVERAAEQNGIVGKELLRDETDCHTRQWRQSKFVTGDEFDLHPGAHPSWDYVLGV